MSESKLRDQSFDFAVSVINLVKDLKSKHETIISNQIGRSGTSIGANIREAQYAHGKPDFIAKLQIALKEANETGYWLELLYKTDYLDEQTYKSLDAACASIRAMLISSVNKAKTINHLSKGILKNETDFIRRTQCPKTLWRDAVRFLSENKIGCERVVI